MCCNVTRTVLETKCNKPPASFLLFHYRSKPFRINICNLVLLPWLKWRCLKHACLLSFLPTYMQVSTFICWRASCDLPLCCLCVDVKFLCFICKYFSFMPPKYNLFFSLKCFDMVIIKIWCDSKWGIQTFLFLAWKYYSLETPSVSNDGYVPVIYVSDCQEVLWLIQF